MTANRDQNLRQSAAAPSPSALRVLKVLAKGKATHYEMLIRTRPLGEPSLTTVIYQLLEQGLVHLADDGSYASITDAGREALR